MYGLHRVFNVKYTTGGSLNLWRKYLMRLKKKYFFYGEIVKESIHEIIITKTSNPVEDVSRWPNARYRNEVQRIFFGVRGNLPFPD